jgi:hypothetical protein
MPVGWLAIFSPATLALMAPSLLVNLASGNAQMQSLEQYHYAAPLVPFVVAAGVMGVAWIGGQKPEAGGRRPEEGGSPSDFRPPTSALRLPASGFRLPTSVILLSVWALACTLAYHHYRGFTPLAEGFAWPQVTAHARRLDEIARLIPPEASLSAQSNLNPHFSQRARINLFPYSLETDYLLLDAATLTANKDNFVAWTRDQVVNGGQFGIVTATDGYLLLKRGAPPQPLPDEFYTFLRTPAPAPEYPLTVDFTLPGTGVAALRVHGYDIAGRRGEERRFTLYLEALRPLAADYQIALFEAKGDGQTVGATTEPPVALVWYPTRRWQPGEIIRVEFDPVAWWTRAKPQFQVALGIYEGGEVWDVARRLRPDVVKSAWQVRLPGERTLLQLATLRNQIWGAAEEVPPRLFTPPAIPQRVNADLGGQVRLLGYDAGPTEVKPGQEVHVRLYWQALIPLADSYTVFVHLLASDNQVRGQRDTPPGGGMRPTDTWVQGEIIVDDVKFTVAPESPPGPCQIEVGMYLPATGARLPISDAAGNPLGDRVLLTRVITVE